MKLAKYIGTTFLMLLLLISCSVPGKNTSNLERVNPKILLIRTESKIFPLISSFVENTGGVKVSESKSKTEGYIFYAKVISMGRGEWYKISRKGEYSIVITGGYPLGIQYGLAHLMELIGYRFFTPYEIYVPKKIDKEKISENIEEISGKLFSPAMSLRGLHLHTLHPIEALYDIWLGDDMENAYKIIDWIVKIRGNYVQWVALDDILKSKDRYRQWLNKTKRIIEYAHKRGLKVGINILVFAKSSLQHGYTVGNTAPVFLKDLDFDLVNLSFGEFFSESPDYFISSVSKIVDIIKKERPNIKISGTVHVGNYPDMWVNYKGERLLYYFLIRFVDNITSWVHTVMYFNLFDPACHAYNHENFSLHRDFLEDYINRGKEVAYFPESAYWIAFDNSVPQYFPLYIFSRWLDQFRIKNLKEHILFSSGWEWGYWQNDYTTLRFNYYHPNTWTTEIDNMFSPLKNGGIVSSVVKKLAKLQRKYLIYKCLSPYIAGIDLYVALSYMLDKYSQPRRVTILDAYSMNEQDKKIFVENVIKPLQEYKEALNQLLDEIGNVPLDSWGEEVKDGVSIDYYRAEFIYDVYRSVLDKNENFLKKAESIYSRARKITENRAKHFHYKTRTLVDSSVNPTIYQFGYLKQANELCLWRRELNTAKNLLTGDNLGVPDCIH